MIRYVRRASASASARRPSDPPSRFTSAAARATSVPPPIATPTHAAASAGASLTPSPTKTTRGPRPAGARPPRPCRPASPPPGRGRCRPARATASAVTERSPVRIATSSPDPRSSPIASAASGRTTSATPSTPDRHVVAPDREGASGRPPAIDSDPLGHVGRQLLGSSHPDGPPVHERRCARAGRRPMRGGRGDHDAAIGERPARPLARSGARSPARRRPPSPSDLVRVGIPRGPAVGQDHGPGRDGARLVQQDGVGGPRRPRRPPRP